MDETKTLFEIENSFDDSGNDKIIPTDTDWTPQEKVLPLSDAYKTYTHRADLVESILTTPKASIPTKIDYGLKRVWDAFMDIPENTRN